MEKITAVAFRLLLGISVFFLRYSRSLALHVWIILRGSPLRALGKVRPGEL